MTDTDPDFHLPDPLPHPRDDSTVEIEAYLDQMERLLADARRAPLSASVMVNRKEFDDLLADARDHLPEELRQARWILKERDDLLAAAAREAEQLRADARAEQERLVSETELTRAARREARRVVEEAQEQARHLRLEAEDYVDSKLAAFEIVLQRTLASVVKGREQLRGRYAADALAPDELAAEATADRTAGDARDGDGARQLYDHERGEAR